MGASETAHVETKVCRKCGETKPLSEYPMRRDSQWPEAGLFPIAHCRDCERARNRKNARLKRARAKGAGGYQNDVIRYSVAEAERRAIDRRVRGACRDSAAARRGAERARRRLRARPRLLTPEERRERWRTYQSHRRASQPMRTRARRAIQHAVEAGRIGKPEHCQRCGEATPTELLHGHHHNGYARVKSRVVCKSERKLLDASVRLPWRPPWARGVRGPGNGARSRPQ